MPVNIAEYDRGNDTDGDFSALAVGWDLKLRHTPIRLPEGDALSIVYDPANVRLPRLVVSGPRSGVARVLTEAGYTVGPETDGCS